MMKASLLLLWEETGATRRPEKHLQTPANAFLFRPKEHRGGAAGMEALRLTASLRQRGGEDERVCGDAIKAEGEAATV